MKWVPCVGGGIGDWAIAIGSDTELSDICSSGCFAAWGWYRLPVRF